MVCKYLYYYEIEEIENIKNYKLKFKDTKLK